LHLSSSISCKNARIASLFAQIFLDAKYLLCDNFCVLKQMGEGTMDAYQKLSYELGMTVKLHISNITEELARAGITRPQIMVLEQIKEKPKTIGEISKKIDLSYSTVSGIVDRLERDKIVTRTRDTKDRRIVWVSLAEGAKGLEQRIRFLRPEYGRELFEGMNEEDLQNATQALLLLQHYLERKRNALRRERGSGE
jgi:DNA-binding MarR family transcriptional regulator